MLLILISAKKKFNLWGSLLRKRIFFLPKMIGVMVSCCQLGAHEISSSFQSQSIRNSIVLSDLKGIVLLGPNQCLPKKTQEVDWVGLNIPGNPKNLRNKLAVFLGKPVSAETLVNIKKTIADYYISESYPFVIVKVPEQDVTSGILQVFVTESRLGTLSVEGNRYVSSEQIKKNFKIKPGQRIYEKRLLQSLSFINRNPFQRADLVFAPGTEVDTTNVIIAVKDRRPLRIYAGSDNLAVELLGPNQWYAGFNWGNAFGLGHILSYQYTAAYNIQRLQAHTAQYTAFLSWGHILDVYGGYSEVHQPVTPPFKRNSGWSMQASARYTIPLKIYPYLEHEIITGADVKRTNNTFEFTEVFPLFGKNVNLTQVLLGYNGNYERNTYRVDFKGNFFWSPGRWLPDQTNADYSSLRPGAVNQWVYFRGYFAYLQRLPRSFSLSLRATGQGSSQPLIPSEQFGLGGYETVRGYEERELNVDNAIVLNLEVRSPGLPIAKWMKPTCTIPDALQFLVFLDYGWGDYIVPLPATPKTAYLMGAGPGVRYTLEPYLTARLDWGVRLHNEDEFVGNWNRFHFNVTASY